MEVNRIIYYTIAAITTFIRSVHSNSCIANTQEFIRATHLTATTFDAAETLGLNFEITATHVDEFLNDRCHFVPMPNLATRMLCDKACSVHASCMAYTFGVDAAGWFHDVTWSGGCELCASDVRISGSDVIAVHAHEDVMIGLESFREYILGNVYSYCLLVLSHILYQGIMF